jgi:hypothetical protein
MHVSLADLMDHHPLVELWRCMKVNTFFLNFDEKPIGRGLFHPNYERGNVLACCLLLCVEEY